MVVLATRTWGADEPHPWNSGAPEREGSRQPEGVPTAVHSPLAVLVHGVTSSSRTWWRVGPALAERGYRVLAVDLRGHGASPRTEGGLSVADLADDVAETVEAARAPLPVDLLVGHSLGALVALELVGRRPGFARRLVVEDPPGSGSIDWAGLAAGIEADTRLAPWRGRAPECRPGRLRRPGERGRDPSGRPLRPPGSSRRRAPPCPAAPRRGGPRLQSPRP